MLSQTYRDIVVGSIAWVDYPKNADLLLIPLCIAAVFLATALAFQAIPKKTRVGWVQWALSSWKQGPALACALVAVSGIAISWLLQAPMHRETITLFVCAAALLLLADAKKIPWRKRIDSALNTTATLFLGATGALSALRFTLPHVVGGEYVWPLVLCSIGIFVFLLAKESDAQMRAWIVRVRWLQILAPFLFLRLAILPLEQGEISLVVAPSFTGTVLLLLSTGALSAATAWQMRKSAAATLAWPSRLSLGAFFAYVVPFASPLVIDDFHLSEILLPWHQIVEKGSAAYREFVPIQGWMAMFTGAINASIYSANADTVLVAKSLGEALLGGMGFLLAANAIGTRAWWLLPSLHLFINQDRFGLVLICTALLFQPPVVARPHLRFALFPLLAMTHCLFNAPVGIAWSIAFSPLLWFIRPKWNNRALFSCVALWSAFIALFFPWISGWVRFVVENGPSNSIAYGVGFLETHAATPDLSFAQTTLIEFLRSGGWIVSIAIGALLVGLQRKSKQRELLVLGAALVLLPIFLIPYSLGRMDPLAFSRTGAASLAMAGVLAVFVCAWALKVWPGSPLWFASLGLCIGYSQAFFPTHLTELASLPAATSIVPSGWTLFEGKDAGMPKIGTVFAPERRWSEIAGFKQVLSDFKNPKDLYLDLTNRSAFYAFVDEKCPVPIAADYLAFNETLQNGNLKRLQDSPPAFVWLGPSMRHDGGPASLRHYRVYRWLLESGLYTVQSRGPFKFLVHNTKNPNGKLDGKLDADQIAQLETIFHWPELQKLPIAWGKSWDTLRSRFTSGADSVAPPELYSRKEPTRISASLQGGALRGGEFPKPDFLVLEIGFESPAATTGRGTLRWREKSNGPVNGSFHFDWKAGTVVIPVGSSPAWLLASTIEDVDVELDSTPIARVRRFTAYRLVH